MIARPSLFIFDLDGTLVQYELEYVFTEALKALPAMGYSTVDRAVLEHWFGLDNMFGFAPAEDHARLDEVFWGDFNRGNYPAPRLIPGAIETLSVLKSCGIQSAIVTSRAEDPEHILHMLEPTGLMRFAECFKSRTDVTTDWRVKEQLYREACEACKTAPSETWVVGDNPSDIMSAHSIKAAHTIGVLSGKIYREVLETAKPDVILESVREIPEYCAKRGMFPISPTTQPPWR